MLNEKAVRERMHQVRETLSKLDIEREILLDMLRADERWLQLQAIDNEPLPLNSTNGRPKNGPPLMLAIQRILYAAHGTPLHVKEIWARAEAMGAVTKADSPLSATDVTCFNLTRRGVAAKAGPRQYRWVGSEPPPAPESTREEPAMLTG